MIRSGTIKVCNTFGQLCDVPYRYENAMGDFELVPTDKFTSEDTARARAMFPNYITSLIVLDQEDVRQTADAPTW